MGTDPTVRGKRALVNADAAAFSREDWEALVRLLRRYADSELDQWESWTFLSRHGPVYISIARELLDGHRPGAFDDLDAAEERS